jgi:orotate phosphoribosyltransferase
MENTIAEMLIKRKAIVFGEFSSPNGVTADYIINMKSVITHPASLSLIAHKIIQEFDFDTVASVVISGLPIATTIAMIANKPLAIIRKIPADHNLKEAVIGDVKGENVLLIEDVTSKGESALYGVKALRASGAMSNRVVTIINKEQGAEQLLKLNDIRLYALSTVKDLKRLALS